MILYDPTLKASLFEFGIEIPIFDTRATKTFEALKSEPKLAKTIDRWHLGKIEGPLTREDLLRVHSDTYVGKLFSSGLEKEIIRTFELVDARGHYHRYNPANARLPLTRLFDRIFIKAGGTLQCCRAALESGFCFYFSGGMHHAQKDFGNGFCMINDIVIAARGLKRQKSVEKVWVIDVDAHKGDGTAALTAGDDSIITLSIHMARGWPLDGSQYDRRGNLNPSFIPSDIDIPIGRDENQLYMEKLEEGLQKLDAHSRPDLAIVVSGADPYEKDELPSTADLKLTLPQLMARDQLVYQFLTDRNIPRAYLMAGGYGQSTWQVYTQFLLWVMGRIR